MRCSQVGRGHARPKDQESPVKRTPKAGRSSPTTGSYFLSLELENVRCFSERQTLDLSDGDGRPARWTILLGENGTGKTTILQLLAGFEEVTWEPRSDETWSRKPRLLNASFLGDSFDTIETLLRPPGRNRAEVISCFVIDSRIDKTIAMVHRRTFDFSCNDSILWTLQLMMYGRPSLTPTEPGVAWASLP